jgi:hypothetical protein
MKKPPVSLFLRRSVRLGPVRFNVSLTSNRIRVFIEKRRKANLKNATINRGTEVLRRAYQLAVDERRLSAQFMPKVPHLPENNARQGFFEKHELNAVLPHLPEPLDDMARFAAIRGWRLAGSSSSGGMRSTAALGKSGTPTRRTGRGEALPLDEEDWKLIERRWTAREFQTKSGLGLSPFVFHRNGKAVHRTTFETSGGRPAPRRRRRARCRLSRASSSTICGRRPRAIWCAPARRTPSR